MSITDWNPKQALLKDTIRNKDKFTDAIVLCKDMHKFVHLSDISSTKEKTIADELWNGLEGNDFNIMPTDKDVTIAWNIRHLNWHILHTLK